MSRKVFWGASNPFITGIFPARCEVPHQSLPTRVVREESAEGARGKGGRRRREGEKDGERGRGRRMGMPPPPRRPRRRESPARQPPVPPAPAARRGDRGAPCAPPGHPLLASCGEAAGRKAGNEGKATCIHLQLEHRRNSRRPGAAEPSSGPQPGLNRPVLTSSSQGWPRLEAQAPRFVSNISTR